MSPHDDPVAFVQRIRQVGAVACDGREILDLRLWIEQMFEKFTPFDTGSRQELNPSEFFGLIFIQKARSLALTRRILSGTWSTPRAQFRLARASGNQLLSVFCVRVVENHCSITSFRTERRLRTGVADCQVAATVVLLVDEQKARVTFHHL